MNKEYIIGTALRALPSDNMRKEEMFAVECAMRMVADFVLGDMPTIPADKDATIRELTVECIARARRIDELEKEMAGLLSDNKRISVDRGMAIDAIKDGVNVTNELELRIKILDDQLRYARATVIELEHERTKLNQQAFSMAIELDIEKKKVGELLRDIAAERDLVSRLMRENARINLGNMFERGEQASEELTHEFVVYAPKTKIEGANIPTEDTQP